MPINGFERTKTSWETTAKSTRRRRAESECRRGSNERGSKERTKAGAHDRGREPSCRIPTQDLQRGRKAQAWSRAIVAHETLSLVGERRSCFRVGLVWLADVPECSIVQHLSQSRHVRFRVLREGLHATGAAQIDHD